VYAVSIALGLFAIGTLHRFTWWGPYTELHAHALIMVQVGHPGAAALCNRCALPGAGQDLRLCGNNPGAACGRLCGRCRADAAQCIILIGVLVMSGSKCRLFLEALDEEGALTYFFGLGAAHHATAMQANDLEAGRSCCTTRQS